ncbi:MAG: hypothetical protein KatS3mg102_0130 [Planctomycetota bacterium]|nr:MAG: hypothetical protein KatS3mg102_0130 [Planctomycetota bacterium]
MDELFNAVVDALPASTAGKVFAIVVILAALAPLAYLGGKMVAQWWRARRERRTPARTAPPRPALRPRTLSRIWKRFLRQIPWEFRRAILRYQPFVVLGAAGSGKTALISTFTDWQGQAARFYSSYSVERELQIYLGSQALVQEIPSALLDDISQAARTALVKLWKRTLRKREPIAVIALNAAALRGLAPDAIRRQAQVMRGKINVIARLRGKPVETRLVLTHMDKVDGFLAFSQFLDRHDIPLVVDLSAPATRADLSQALVPYERYLPLALTTMSAKAYKKVLTFLAKVPALLSLVDIFARTLCDKDPLSHEPELKELYLTTDSAPSSTAAANPFTSSWDPGLLEAERLAHRRHRWAATAAAAALLAMLIGGFVLEHREYTRAMAALAAFEKSPQPSEAEQVRVRLAALQDGAGPALMGLVPRFFSHAEQGVRSQFLDLIRTRYLLPALEHAAAAADPQDRTLFLLALLYATRDNDLGRLVRERAADWAGAVLVPEHLIRTYVEQSRTQWDGLAPLPAEAFKPAPRAVSDLQPWLAFFMELEDALRNPSLAPADLEQLRQTATERLNDMAAARRNQFAVEVYTRLRASTRLPLQSVFGPYIETLTIPYWMSRYGDAIESTLLMVRAAHLELPAVEGMTLPQLFLHLQALSQLPRSDTVHRFALADRDFAFEPRSWHRLIATSRMRLLIQRFVAHHRRAAGRSFFGKGERYPDIVMNPTNLGEFLFAGKGRVPGLYTRPAYEGEVRRVVLALQALLAEARLDETVRADLNNFISQEVEHYAIGYEEAWRKYYQAFAIRAESLGGLLIALDQMQLPDSPFAEFLRTVATHTALDTSASPLLRPLAEHLRDFQFVNLLLQQKQGAELETYRLILRRIHADLQGVPPEQGDAAAKPATVAAPPEFLATLSPLARVSLGILQEHRDSYLRLVERWLDNTGIVAEWRAPFMAPVSQLYELGLADLQAAVLGNWRNRVLTVLLPMASRFPFNPQSTTDIAPLELEKVLHPATGSFWERWRQYAAPVCRESGGRWAPLGGPGEAFRLPSVIFELVDHLAAVRDALWDRDGNPQPLVLFAYPHPLPAGQPGEPAGTLSFLRTGKASAFGFNQKQAWQRFAWEWWQSYPCQVGLQMGDPRDDDVWYRTLTVPQAFWALLKLLRMGERRLGNTWSWTLREGGEPLDAPAVRFSFRDDPWQPFAIEGLLAAARHPGGRPASPAARPAAPAPEPAAAEPAAGGGEAQDEQHQEAMEEQQEQAAEEQEQAGGGQERAAAGAIEGDEDEEVVPQTEEEEEW